MTWKQACCIVTLAGAAACAAPKVGYDYDSSANFNVYRTYEWLPGNQESAGDQRVDNALVDRRIRTAVDARLRSQGYHTPVNGKPDFYVAYRVAVKDRMKGSSTQRYIGDFAYGTHTTITDIQPYNEGDLVVDVVDAETKQLVWRSYAQGEVSPGMTPDERDKRIAQVVDSMFSHFPPK
jgi:hypothetical protein